MKQDHTLYIYKADKRTKSGERFVKSYDYKGFSGNAMMDEVKDLKQFTFKPADGYSIKW